jgi:anti-sigma factor ChrR (cupin superfamily)
MTGKDRDLAAELVLGALDQDAHRAARIRAREDRNFAAEVEAWEARLAPLGLPESSDPPPFLLDRIEAQIDRRGALLPGTATKRAHTGDWKEIHPGFRVKLLNRIESLNRQTVMVQLDPGAEFRAHPHSQDEEIIMISGDLIMGELTLYAGDFHVARADRVHPVSTTRTGCVCIISQAIDW